MKKKEAFALHGIKDTIKLKLGKDKIKFEYDPTK